MSTRRFRQWSNNIYTPSFDSHEAMVGCSTSACWCIKFGWKWQALHLWTLSNKYFTIVCQPYPILFIWKWSLSLDWCAPHTTKCVSCMAWVDSCAPKQCKSTSSNDLPWSLLVTKKMRDSSPDLYPPSKIFRQLKEFPCQEPFKNCWDICIQEWILFYLHFKVSFY